MKRLHYALVVLALAVPSSPAFAGDKDKNKDKDKAKPAKVEKHKVVIVDTDRQAAQSWWRQTYGRNCPPGLAKKNNGCLPPGRPRRGTWSGSPCRPSSSSGPFPRGFA